MIREMRKRLGMSQDALAEAAETTRRTVGSIERGDSTGQPQKIERILKVLGLDPKAPLPADVTAFLVALEGLLPRIDAREREILFPQVFELVLASLDVTHDVEAVISDSDARKGRA